MVTLSSRARRRLKIAVSVLLVGGLVYFLDTDALVSSVTELDFRYLLLALAMVFVNRVLMPLKWNLLLRARGVYITNFEAVRVYTMSSFLGLVLPPTVGADSVRSFYLKQSGIKLSDTVASIVIERIFGLVVLLIFTLLGFAVLIHLLRGGELDFQTFAIVLLILSTLMLTCVYFSFTPLFQRLVDSLATRSHGTRFAKLGTGLNSLVQAYQEYRQKKTVLALFCGLTGLELALVIVRSYVVALSLGVDLAIIHYLAFLPMVNLLNRMPISFDGFGINEALFIYFLALFGVSAEKGFLIGLINHLIFLIGISPGAFFYIMSDRKQRDL